MFKSTKTIATILLLMVFAVGCTKPEDPSPGGNDAAPNDSVGVNGHEYVDLGLPSGILWATCNVGAESPEDFGEYFAWGEVVPKDVYDWDTYKYGDFVNDRFALTKYCIDMFYGQNGFVDSLTVLEPSDDAATVNWGVDWRMPTRKDWEELYHTTTCVWTTQNGVDGRLLTGPNGNSIFLPAAGFCMDGELYGSGLGIYWSGTLHSDFTIRGWSFHFDSVNCHVCGTYERCRGQVVRAVRSVR